VGKDNISGICKMIYCCRSPAVTGIFTTAIHIAPDFDLADFELADADILAKDFPKHARIFRDPGR
jgi:hypothetical protein